MKLEWGYDSPKKLRLFWGRVGRFYVHLTACSLWKNWDLGILVRFEQRRGQVSCGPLEAVITWEKEDK